MRYCFQKQVFGFKKKKSEFVLRKGAYIAALQIRKTWDYKSGQVQG